MNFRRSAASSAVRFLALAVGMTVLFGCGGGSNSGGGGTTPPVVTVSVSPASATVLVGATKQFTATVTGTSNTSVTWSLSGGAGQNLGTISSTGLYTAPASVPSPAQVTVKVTSQADTSKFASATVTVSNVTVNNTATIEVGPEPDLGSNSYVNLPFVDVTICEPGSTTNCQIIHNVEVDTGSEGLRLLKTPAIAALNLPAVTDNTTNQLQECVQFADGSYIWGPIYTADVQIADEKASSVSVGVNTVTGVPIQLIPSSPLPGAPSACTSGGGSDLSTLADLGANGIIGLGVFQQDCGAYCEQTTPLSADPYYLCTSSLSSSCVQASVPLAFQLQNPVWLFPQDNNGFSISLPSIANDGAVSVSGTITFGIGTKANNALNGATVLTADASGNFRTTYNGVTYGAGDVNNPQTNLSYIDSGSNGLYILNAATLGQSLANCTQSGFTAFYCPGSDTSVNLTTFSTATNSGAVSPVNSAPANFSYGNAYYLFYTANGGGNWAFSDLGGDSGASFPTFDFGLPFFFGKTIFVGIENQTVGGATGPLWAY